MFGREPSPVRLDKSLPVGAVLARRQALQTADSIRLSTKATKGTANPVVVYGRCCESIGAGR
jgi:hypothetical protein